MRFAYAPLGAGEFFGDVFVVLRLVFGLRFVVKHNIGRHNRFSHYRSVFRIKTHELRAEVLVKSDENAMHKLAFRIVITHCPG